MTDRWRACKEVHRQMSVTVQYALQRIVTVISVLLEIWSASRRRSMSVTAMRVCR